MAEAPIATDDRPPLRRAETLGEAYRTLDPRPLVRPEEITAFYQGSINDFRGENHMDRMALGLSRAWGGLHYKALLMGHSGVGKSTELTRLLNKPLVKSRFQSIRLSVTDHLDPVGFKPFDVLLLMLDEVARETAKKTSEGGTGQRPPDELLRKVYDWFASERQTTENTTAIAAQAEAGAGPGPENVFAKLLGLFARVRGEMKYASARKKETVEYRLSQLNSFVEAANGLLGECNRLLYGVYGREWLFVIEDFDKAGVSPRATEDFFVTYANMIKGLQCHLVFTLPIELGYSSKPKPVPDNKIFCIPDTMVFHKNHTAHIEARAAMRAVLEARIDSKLFADGQLERLIVASGGNLRDLFALTNSACDRAILRQAERIEAEDITKSIRELRTNYQRRLGDSPYDETLTQDGRERITYAKKAERLLRIYKGEKDADVPDPILYSLLRSRAVQEFNGERWFGIHPLVVDILGEQGKEIGRLSGDAFKGGTI